MSSNANGNNLGTYDNGTILIFSKGISGEHGFLLYFFLLHISELDCIAQMLLEFQNLGRLLLLILWINSFFALCLAGHILLSIVWGNRAYLCLLSARKWFVSAEFHAILLFYCFYILAKVIFAEVILQILVPEYYFVQLHLNK